MFTLTIKTDNAAFCDDDDNGENDDARGAELARILKALAGKLRDGAAYGDGGTVVDANGNTVGHWTLGDAG